MKKFLLLSCSLLFLIISCKTADSDLRDYTSVYRSGQGKPVSVLLSVYSTTLIANGTDQTRIRVALADSSGREIATGTDTVRVYLSGDGKILLPDGSEAVVKSDTGKNCYVDCFLEKGIGQLSYVAGTEAGKVKLEARSGKCWPGSHEIHLLPAGFVQKKPSEAQLPKANRTFERIIGADISFLPQLEAEGKKFYDGKKEKDAITLLRDHGFNYIRLRVFVDPAREKGYSPGKGFCDLDHTLAMARRVKASGMKLLLDFHYSDYWADPQQQFKPGAWEKADFTALKDSVKTYTARVLTIMKKEGLLPALVQVGNEINHGMLWPEGHISQPDQLAELLKAGAEGVKSVSADLPVMMHIALGGQNEEAVFWLDNMIARGVTFDMIGLSYYPRWHGTLDDLKANLEDLLKRYHKPLNVVEYSDYKKEVHDICFGLPGNMGTGACIWEPLNSRSGLFDENGKVTDLMKVYDDLSRKYLSTPTEGRK